MPKSKHRQRKQKRKNTTKPASHVKAGTKATSPLHNAAQPPSGRSAENQEPPVKFSNSNGLGLFLQKWKIGIIFTSYQSNLLYFIGSWPNQLNVHQTAIDKPMGVYVSDKDTLHLACNHGIYEFHNVLDDGQFLNNNFDGCFMPRRYQHTGQLDGHDIGVTADGEVVFVNTRFNCLATPCKRHSFQAYWMPPFISQLVDEDRCHLNGMAIKDGKVKYVTAVSKSNTIDGWRDRRSNGGIVIDVETNEIVCEGLSMPHSPRVHGDKLWLLNSGTGSLGYVDFDNNGKGKFIEKVFCPGFVRGVAFHEHYAFVGLSKPRYERFEGLELDDRLKQADSEPWCGIQVIDLNKGSCVEWFRIDGIVAELYDVNIIPGINMPMAMAPGSIDANTLITFDSQYMSKPV